MKGQLTLSVQAALSLLVWLSAGQTDCPAQPVKAGLKVVEHIWGFDGRVQPGQFNPLSILLDNQTDQAVEAEVTLQRMQTILNPTGGLYTTEIFISPAARRWVQLYPYVSDTRGCEWQLNLDGKKIAEFTQPRPAWKTTTDKIDPPPQVIILDRAGRINTQPASVKHFPENIFPPYSTVTFGLHTLFLDHMPDWESPRQEAFMSWLKQGGNLHILRTTRGETPRFSGAMTDLNQPLRDRFTVGMGTVTKHTIQRNAVSEDVVRSATVINVLKDVSEDLDQQIEDRLEQGRLGAFVETEPSSIDDTIFRRMRELTLPEHAWWLIFLLALVYIGLIFPGCFALSKKKDLHFLATYGAIVGLAVVFSALFLVIGRRGYGEKTNLQTIAYARAEQDGIWNTFQWNTLFVTAGDLYSATAENQQAALSTADTFDRSEAKSSIGSTSTIDMRIPPFSSQTFVSRRRVSAAPWNLKIKNINFDGSGLKDLTLSVGDSFPRDEDTAYLVLVGRRVYEMRYDADTASVYLLGQKKSLAEICQPNFSQDYANPFSQPQPGENLTEQEIFFDDSFRWLVQRCLLDDLVNKPSRFELPSDRIRLFVYTKVPDTFVMNISAEAKVSGRILFSRDILITAGEDNL